ncbi:MAG: hypothetical protein K2X50_06140 [Gammaproteobacteria bacterium]|nr:hypothetical protein [Gammaproteobacteria bacterium]
MQAYQDQFIHDLTPEEILSLLKEDPWKIQDQTISSAITNDNDLKEPSDLYSDLSENTAGPNAFSDILFDKKTKKILDVGGGKFDHNRDYMKIRKIDLLVWDPYGRDTTHNNHVEGIVKKAPVDSATSMSVLNVIQEVKVRLKHINTLKAAIKIGGKAYFKIWPGELPLKGSYYPTGNHLYYQANAYADRFLREIETIFGPGNVMLDHRVQNLIIAIKKNSISTDIQSIKTIQKKSILESKRRRTIQHSALNSLTSSTLKFAITKMSFFKTFEESFIEANRHRDPKIQQAYDKRFGLITLTASRLVL